jgi:hypothetical protein
MVATPFQGHGESPVSLRARYSWPPAADTINWVSHRYIMEISWNFPRFVRWCSGQKKAPINWVDPHEPSVQFWREIIRFNGIYALTSQLWRTCSEFSESTWISVWLWKFPRISILLEQCSKPWIILFSKLIPIGIPMMDYENPQNVEDIVEPRIITNQRGCWTHWRVTLASRGQTQIDSWPQSWMARFGVPQVKQRDKSHLVMTHIAMENHHV